MSDLTLKMGEMQALTFRDLVGAFLSGKKKTTLDAYACDLLVFARFVGVADSAEATRALLSLSHGQANALAVRYKSYLIDSGLRPASVNRKLSALRSLVSLGRVFGFVSFELEVNNVPHQPYRDVRGVGANGIKAIFNLLEGKTDPKAIRDNAILRLLFDLGLRRAEVCNLELKDVDLKKSIVAVLGKGRTEKDFLSLPEQTAISLDKWLGIRGHDAGPLFYRLDKAKGETRKRLSGTGLYLILRERGREAGIPGMTVHKVRHSAITTCAQVIAENQLGVESLIKFSRHRSLSTALVYMDHLENKQGQLARLVSKKAS